MHFFVLFLLGQVRRGVMYIAPCCPWLSPFMHHHPRRARYYFLFVFYINLFPQIHQESMYMYTEITVKQYNQIKKVWTSKEIVKIVWGLSRTIPCITRCRIKIKKSHVLTWRKEKLIWEKYFVDWLTDCLMIDWFVYWLIDWLID